MIAESTKTPWIKRVPWGAVWNGITALAGAGGVVIASIALSASANAARVDQRAWVGVANVHAEQKLVDRQPLVVTTTVQNYGKTPAKNLVSTGFLSVLSKGKWPDIDKEFSKAGASPYGIVYPSATLSFHSPIYPLPSDIDVAP